MLEARLAGAADPETDRPGIRHQATLRATVSAQVQLSRTANQQVASPLYRRLPNLVLTQVPGRSQWPGVGLVGGCCLGSDGGDQGAGPVAPDPQLTAEGGSRDGLTGPHAVRGVEVSRPGEQSARKHRGLDDWGGRNMLPGPA